MKMRQLAARFSALSASATLLVTLLAGCASPVPHSDRAVADHAARRVILMVWDGLRPDSVTPADTPNLARLRAEGVEFTDQHSLYPTITMMNATALATGAYPAATAFYANTTWRPDIPGTVTDADGDAVDFSRPMFTEDYAVLEAIAKANGGRLFPVETLFDAAQRAGLRTATLGKSGPAFLQDSNRGGIIIDENQVWPATLAHRVQAAGEPLPTNTPRVYPDGSVRLVPDNGNPTARRHARAMRDGGSADPTDTSGSAAAAANRYMLKIYIEHVLPDPPALSVIWFREPDSSEHAYGPGSFDVHAALRQQDQRLGELLAALDRLHLRDSTNLMIVSDHAHSSISGPLERFPLRDIVNGAVAGIDPANGYSVSGEIRLAEVLRDADLAAYDGRGCVLSPALAGIGPDDEPLRPTRVDRDGSVCGKPGTRYTSGDFRIPHPLPAHAIVVIPNAGSAYLYSLDHDPATVRRAVRALANRTEVGPIFVAQRYGDVPGALPMNALHLESPWPRSPDLVLSLAWNADAQVRGMPGTIFDNLSGARGSHGSLSPRDVHNTLIAIGPDFRKAFRDPLPSANVDVAPTIATLLGLALPDAAGRPLREALAGPAGRPASAYRLEDATRRAATPATGLHPAGSGPKSRATSARSVVAARRLCLAGDCRDYFDSGWMERR
jgi:arylsulfatase A-like enzyme